MRDHSLCSKILASLIALAFLLYFIEPEIAIAFCMIFPFVWTLASFVLLLWECDKVAEAIWVGLLGSGLLVLLLLCFLDCAQRLVRFLGRLFD